MTADIEASLAGIDEAATLEAITAALERGEDPLSLVEMLRSGMATVGSRFEAKEYFLPDLIMSAEIFRESMALVELRLGGAGVGAKGAIVLGTVKGDIHDIGKNIVATMLRISGYEVHDIGVDQAPSAFVDKARETGARLAAMSGLLTLAFDSMKETVAAFADAGIRPGVSLIIGGGPVDGAVLDYSGADALGRDPVEAVRLAERYLGG